MSKHSLQKSTILLTMFAAVLASTSLVEAEETPATSTAPVANLVEAPAAESSDSTATPEATTETVTTTEATPSVVSNEAPLTESTSSENETVASTATPSEATTVATNETTTTTAPTTTTNTNEKPTTPQEGDTVDVRILSTTDLHTNLVNYDYYQDKPSQTIGLAKTAVLIDKAKEEKPNVLLVDNGDIIQGTPLGTYKSIIDPVEAGETHPMYAALDKLGFDAGTLGNHEFNYGLEYLDKVISTAGMPIVNANVVDTATGNLRYKPYEIITKSYKTTDGKTINLNIGITGIVPPQILNWDKALLEGKITVKDSVEAVKSVIPAMQKAGADIILVLSHSGIGDDVYEVGEENVGYQIAGIDGVDAVVTGHSHAEFPSGKGTGFYEKYKDIDGVNGLITGTPVTMAGKYGDHLGIIDLGLTRMNGKWQVTKSHAEIRKIDTKSDEAKPEIITIAKESHEATIKYVRKQVGTTTAPITSYFALVKDDPSIQIVNKAQIWYAKQELKGTAEANLPILSAAAPFKAGTRGDATAYTDIPAGPIAIKNVADLYLYDNVTAILKVTGADLKEWLEMSAGQFNTIDPTSKAPQNMVNTNYRTYNFDVIDGVTYEFDITQPNKYDKDGKLVNAGASRVRNLKYQGKDVAADQEFIVVTNNYRASGQFPGVVNATVNRLLGLENRQVIINYILAEKTINPSADNNWYFSDTIKGLDLRFQTADKARDSIGAHKDIQYIAASAEAKGFGDFTFTYVKPEEPQIDPMPIDPATKPGKQADAQNMTYQPGKTSAPSAAINTTAKSTATTTLPNTGESSGTLLSLLGLFLMSVLTFFHKGEE